MFYEPVGIFGLVILVIDVLMIVSILPGNGSTNHKLIWTLVILALPVIGLILYLLIGRSSADRPITDNR